MASQPHPPNGNGHHVVHIPKWAVAGFIALLFTQGGRTITDVLGAARQSETSNAAATTAKAAADMAEQQKKHNEATDAQMKYMYQQIMGLHTRLAALEAKGKPP